MEKVLQFLKDAETYYLATVEVINREFVLLEQLIFLRASCISRPEK